MKGRPRSSADGLEPGRPRHRRHASSGAEVSPIAAARGPRRVSAPSAPATPMKNSVRRRNRADRRHARRSELPSAARARVAEPARGPSGSRRLDELVVDPVEQERPERRRQMTTSVTSHDRRHHKAYRQQDAPRSDITREPQRVADAPDGLDERRADAVDLLAQVADVRLDDGRVAAEVVLPDVVEDLVAGQDPAGVGQQEAQELVLGGRQVDRPRPARRTRGRRRPSPGRRSVSQRRCASAALPAQDGLDAGHHLLEAEGLGDVVVAAEGQAPDLVLGGVAGGEEQHRDLVPS